MQLRGPGALLCLLAACATTPAPKKPTSAQFELPDLDGHLVKSEDFKGKVLLVDTWATWCKPCEASMPFYTELKQRYGEQGLEIVAVSVDTEDQAVKDFLAKRPALPFIVVRDPKGSFPERIDIPTMPTMVLLGKDGGVRFIHAGFVEDDKAKIEAEVKAAISGTRPE